MDRSRSLYRPVFTVFAVAVAVAALLIATMVPAVADHSPEHIAAQQLVDDLEADRSEALDALASAQTDYEEALNGKGNCNGLNPDREAVDNCQAAHTAVAAAQATLDSIESALTEARAGLAELDEEHADQEGGAEGSNEGSNTEDKQANENKVWVCKMVGQPGNAQPASGDNPIHVSRAAADANYLSDAHGSFIVDGPDDPACAQSDNGTSTGDENNDNDDNNSNDDGNGNNENSNDDTGNGNNENNDDTGSSSNANNSSSNSDGGTTTATGGDGTDEATVLGQALTASEAEVLGETLAFTGASTTTLLTLLLMGVALIGSGTALIRHPAMRA